MNKLLTDVQPENYFMLADGQVLKNLGELNKALIKMGPEVFSHHVNPERNDFYNWVKDCYNDKKLASELIKATSKTGIKKLLQARLKEAKKTTKEKKTAKKKEKK